MSERSDPTQGLPVSFDDENPVSDAALSELLTSAYVGGGFTDPEVAKAAFAPGAVRARGRLLHVSSSDGAPLALLVIVETGSPAARFATAGEAELHLLATAPAQRNKGLARRLINAALDELRGRGCRRVWLWTQPPMLAAQRLYVSCGFGRSPELDFERGGRTFLVYQLQL